MTAPVPLTRLSNWQSHLTRYLSGVAKKPFEEGTHDCFLFSADAALALTGVDLAEGWRGRYLTTRAGLRQMRQAGYCDHVDYAAKKLLETPPSLARAGDWATLATADGPALGVFQGEMIYVLMRSGLGLLPRSNALRAFKVG